MRSNGVRRENAFKNIGTFTSKRASKRMPATPLTFTHGVGKQKFAFNKLQLKLIPEEYRAPKGTGSGTART